MCLKCGTTQKSGKLSCCARGGAWFKKCGDAGDTEFDHTWVEGMQACKGSRSAVLVELTPMSMLGNVGVVVHPLTTTWSPNAIGQQTNIKCRDGASCAGTMDYEDRVVISKVVIRICVLLIISVA